MNNEKKKIILLQNVFNVNFCNGLARNLYIYFRNTFLGAYLLFNLYRRRVHGVIVLYAHHLCENVIDLNFQKTLFAIRRFAFSLVLMFLAMF